MIALESPVVVFSVSGWIWPKHVQMVKINVRCKTKTFKRSKLMQRFTIHVKVKIVWMLCRLCIIEITLSAFEKTEIEGCLWSHLPRKTHHILWCTSLLWGLQGSSIKALFLCGFNLPDIYSLTKVKCSLNCIWNQISLFKRNSFFHPTGWKMFVRGSVRTTSVG